MKEGIIAVILLLSCSVNAFDDDDFFNPKVVKQYREKVRKMFYHAYDGYLNYAFPLDELKPITCQGQDTWGSFSLSLVDSLDTLLILGNVTEFRRAVELVLKSVRDDADVNVSVFETNIRVVGGLISAHMLAGRHKEIVEEWNGWPCDGPLLKLAVKMADRLLAAFNTETGMPYGTVNLRYGVHRKETPITCTAGVGTFIIEFGTLSRLTGDEKYEKVALKALDALWATKSPIGLVGNHLNVTSGEWTAVDMGIGAGVDSYFEYLVKGAYLFKRPTLMRQFEEYATAINKYVRKEDWFMWVSMNKATVSMPIFQSLEAFWPGLLTLVGDVQDAQRIMLQYAELIRKYGFPPEFYNIHNSEPVMNRMAFPLRPEMVESLMYLYRATKDTIWLELGAEMVDAIESSAKTKCGYATINNVKDHSIEDRMESFFLAETAKYLYLLFDPDNFIHSTGETARILKSPKNLTCAIYAGGYIFNTEAHPVDPGMLDCCSVQAEREQETLKKSEEKMYDFDPNTMSDYGTKLQAKDIVAETELFEEGGGKYFENQYGKDGAQIEFEVDEKMKEEAENKKKAEEKEHFKNWAAAAFQKIRLFLFKTYKDDGGNTKNADGYVDELLKMYPNLTDEIFEANRLARIDFDEDQLLQTKLQMATEVAIPEVFCIDCCYQLDELVDSVEYRIFLAEIYEFQLYPKWNLNFVRGPVCWYTEEPKIEDSYKNEPPTESDLDVDSPEDQTIELDFNDFDVTQFEHLGYKHLLSPGPSFLDQFTGGGHIALRRKSAWYYRE